MSLLKLLFLGSLLGAFAAPVLAQTVDTPVASDDRPVSDKKTKGWFVGIEGGYAWSGTYLDTILVDDDGDKYSGYGADEYNDYSDSVANYGIKVGYYFKNSDMRVYVSFDKNTKAEATDDDIKFTNEVSKLSIGYDAAVAKISENFRFLVGANLGYARLKSTINNYSASYSGVDIGGKFGVIYDINAANEIEFGLKINCSIFEEKKAGEEKIGNKYYDVDILPIQARAGLYLGYNYKF
jgi:hypothetical protein